MNKNMRSNKRKDAKYFRDDKEEKEKMHKSSGLFIQQLI